jgi:hypothetical protein
VTFITKDGEKDKEVAVGSAGKEKTGKTEKESAEDMELEEKKPDGDSLSCKEESDDETLVSATLQPRTGPLIYFQFSDSLLLLSVESAECLEKARVASNIGFALSQLTCRS